MNTESTSLEKFCSFRSAFQILNKVQSDLQTPDAWYTASGSPTKLLEYRLLAVDTHAGTSTFIVSIVFSLIVICFLVIYKFVMYIKSRTEYAAVNAKKSDIKALFEANDEDILDIPTLDDKEEKLHDKFNKYVHNRGRSASELKQRVVQVGVGSDDEWSGGERSD